MKGYVRMRIVKAFMGILLVFFVFSSSCWAMDIDQKTNLDKLWQYASCKTLASQYAFAVQEQYCRDKAEYEATKSTDSGSVEKFKARTIEYWRLQQQYNYVAADGTAWKAMVQLYIVNHKKLPDEEYYYGDELDFLIIGSNNFIRNAENFVFTYPTKGPEVISIITSLIYPGIDRYVSLRNQIETEKKDKRDKLIAWLDTFYKWEDWDTIGKKVTVEKKNDANPTSGASATQTQGQPN